MGGDRRRGARRRSRRTGDPGASSRCSSEIHRTDPKSPLLGEEAINQLGYGLARKKETEAAIAVFELNTELYPSSGNTYDSLAETYLGAGNEELARKYYARALEVQPDYPNAKAAREILETKLH